MLTITNSTPDLAGIYTCHVENVAGIAEKMFNTDFFGNLMFFFYTRIIIIIFY